MSWADSAMSYLQFYGAPVITASISTAYFWADRSATALVRRFLTSAHGLVAAVIHLAALGIWISGGSRIQYAAPFVWFHILPAALILLSLVMYKGPKWLHVLQILNVPAMLWGYLIGVMAITNDWI